MLNTLSHKGNTNQNDTESLSYLGRMTTKRQTITNAGKDAEGKKEPSYAVDENVN
jgi:hypothetical protein